MITKDGISSLKELTFDGMDGVYGKWLDKDGDIIHFNEDFIKEGDSYKIDTRNDIPYWTKNGYRKGWDGIAQELYKECKRIGKNPNDIYIKEKYGRFDITTSGDSEFMDFCTNLENKSMTICDICGKKAKPRWKLGWVRTLCWMHYYPMRFYILKRKLLRWLTKLIKKLI